MKEDIYAIIMAGGRGERFWPLSTPQIPKPFLNLWDDETMIQKTVKRIQTLIPKERTLIVLGEKHLPLAKKQLPEFSEDNFISEPYARDTAACIGLASLYLERRNPEAVMAVLAADHYLSDQEKFLQALLCATQVVAKGEYLLTFGIKPTRIETGYGYIQAGERFTVIDGSSIYKANRFVEKPNFKLAQEYLKQGGYYWNSGIFVWKNKTIQELLERFMPELWKGLGSIRRFLGTPKEKAVLKKEFKELKRISIDYGVLEKVDKVLLLPLDLSWDDLGTWTSLERINRSLDEKGNLVKGRHKGIDTQDCIIYAKKHLIATLGISNLIIVEANGKVLVCSKEYASHLKKLLT